jgi:hypothetical protein
MFSIFLQGFVPEATHTDLKTIFFKNDAPCRGKISNRECVIMHYVQDYTQRTLRLQEVENRGGGVRFGLTFLIIYYFYIQHMYCTCTL